jgi:hypothetical protein
LVRYETILTLVLTSATDVHTVDKFEHGFTDNKGVVSVLYLSCLNSQSHYQDYL